MPVLAAVATAIGAVFAAASLYLFALSLAAAGGGRRHRHIAKRKNTRFVVTVPAHNEELLLPGLLASLKASDYPPSMFDIAVVADNCTDSTAEIAKAAGAIVFVREDLSLRGKGFALKWLLEKLEMAGRRYDAYVFLDADSRVAPNLLSEFDQRIQAGAGALQAYYTVSEKRATPAVGLRTLALALKHYARPLGRKRLGLSCGLFGTGMAFSREVLNDCPWDSFSLAEDAEQYLKLVHAGRRVEFVPGAVVWSFMPATLADSRRQNLRWEQGRLLVAWKLGPGLLAKGLISGSAVMIDAAIEQFIPPLSLLFAGGAAAFAAGLFAGSTAAMASGAIALALLLGHVAAGLAVAPLPARAYRSLVYAPGYILWKIYVYADALCMRRLGWERTGREG